MLGSSKKRKEELQFWRKDKGGLVKMILKR